MWPVPIAAADEILATMKPWMLLQASSQKKPVVQYETADSSFSRNCSELSLYQNTYVVKKSTYCKYYSLQRKKSVTDYAVFKSVL